MNHFFLDFLEILKEFSIQFEQKLSLVLQYLAAKGHRRARFDLENNKEGYLVNSLKTLKLVDTKFFFPRSSDIISSVETLITYPSSIFKIFVVMFGNFPFIF
jgi:hypothetical protein